MYLKPTSKKIAMALLPVIFMFIAGVGTAAPSTASGDAAFTKIVDDYFDNWYFPNSPSQATAEGIHRYDTQLEDYSRAAIDKDIAALQNYEQRIAAIKPGALSEYVQGDQELLLGSIRGALLTLQTIRPWEKNPDSYSSGITSSAFALMSRKFAPPVERLRSLIAREQLMPAALLEARKNLSNPPKIFTQIALEQLPGMQAFFRDDVPSAFTDVSDATVKAQFAKSNAGVIKALIDYEAWLKKEVLPKSNGDFRLGAATYSKKLKFDEDVDTPLDKLLALNLADMHRNQAEFTRIAKLVEPNKSSAQVLAELAADHPAPEKLLETIRDTFNGLIKFIDEKKIITIPSTVRPIVEETPPFMRATTFASMDTPGPFEKVANEAYFNVTLPDPHASKKEVEEYMAQFNYPVISNTAVHEAYPGHYVQFLNMRTMKDRVRQILYVSSNVEGWAHYCEQMMLDEGLAQALAPNDLRRQRFYRLGQLQDALLRNARFTVGIELHTGKMSIEQAEDYFVKEGYQSHSVGMVETKRGAGDPTYLYYTLGKLQILKLRADLQKAEGAAFNLRKFHDDFVRQGGLPIKVVRRAMLHNDSPTL